MNLVAGVHVANLGDELLRRANLPVVDLSNAIAFLDAHLFGGRVREDAHDGDTLVAFADDVHAETGVFTVAAAELARSAFAVDVVLLALLAELTAPLRIAAKLRIAAELLTAELALAARLGEAILLTRLLTVLLTVLLTGLLTTC